MRLVPALVVAGSMLLTATASSHTLATNAGIVWAAGGGIFAADSDGGDRRLVSRYDGPYVMDAYTDPEWSRTGRLLAYGTFGSASGFLHVVGLQTKRTITSRRSLQLSNPSWSPDERALAVEEGMDGEGLRGISVVSLASGGARRLTEPRSLRTDRDPAWSPDGRVIAFTRSVRGQPPVIYTVTLDGRERWVTRGSSPSWSPNGRRLAFAWGDSIYRVDADGSGRTRLAQVRGTRGASLQPRWSPDGRSILFTSRAGIWVMNHDGTGRRRVIRASGSLGGAGWRPG